MSVIHMKMQHFIMFRNLFSRNMIFQISLSFVVKVAISWKISLKHENYLGNSEWDWKSYSYRIENVTSLVRNGLQFSQRGFLMIPSLYNDIESDCENLAKLVIDFEMDRNEPFFSLTLFVPILILTALAPIGLILPGLYSNDSRALHDDLKTIFS